MNFYDNLKSACTSKGLSVSPFVESLGLKSGNTGAWKKGGYPRVENLIEMADALEVTTDYLLGREQKQDPTAIPNDGLNPKIHKITRLLETKNISDDVIDFIYRALEAYKK